MINTSNYHVLLSPLLILSAVKVIPFHPIERGEHSQTIIARKMSDFFSSLNLGGITLENQQAIVEVIEDKLCGRGGLGAIESYLSTIWIKILQNHSWVMSQMAKAKIHLYTSQGQIYAQLSYYLDDFSTYHQVDEPIQL